MKVTFESKGNFNNALSWLKRSSNNKLENTLKQIAEDGERALSKATPEDTGETADGWTSKITTNGDVSEIAWMNTAHPESDVNVAKLIHTGHGTGTGGYVPPRPYINEAMQNNVWKDAGVKIGKELIK